MLPTVYCTPNVSPIAAYPMARFIARRMGNRLGQEMTLVFYMAESFSTAYAKVYRGGSGSRHLYTLDVEGRKVLFAGVTASRPEILDLSDLIVVCSLDRELLG
ncbi:hypothetical protein ONZ45_g13450 [Pleurotus djamor]|nr:hypothetical protein ONZ45_g13450 [Pleurotus djamor]